MSKGIAIALGLNAVNPQHYNGWSGVLNACEADAEDMSHIAKTQKFSVTTILTKAATRKNVMDHIRDAAKRITGRRYFHVELFWTRRTVT